MWRSLFLFSSLALHAKITALYLCVSSNPATSMAVQWHTTQDAPETLLSFEMPDHTWETRVAECVLEEPWCIYKVTLNNLTPDTEYSFRIGVHPKIYHFRTALTAFDPSFSFAIYSKPNPFHTRHSVIDLITNRGSDLFAENAFFKFPIYPPTTSFGEALIYPYSSQEPIRESCEKTRAAFQRIYTPDLRPDPLSQQAQTAASKSEERKIFHADPGTDYGGVCAQDAFDAFVCQTVSLVAQMIQSLADPKDFSLYATLQGIALLRLKMSIETKTGDILQLGMWRIRASAISMYEDDPHPYLAIYEFTPLPQESRYSRYRKRIQSMLSPGNEAIEITKNLEGSELKLSILREEYIEHASAIHTVKIIDALEKKIQTILEQGPKSELFKDLAFVHWWLAHLTPFFRGSASCIEILIQALAVAKGFAPPRLAGIPQDDPENGFLFGDLEAICLPLEQFVDLYESMTHRFTTSS